MCNWPATLTRVCGCGCVFARVCRCAFVFARLCGCAYVFVRRCGCTCVFADGSAYRVHPGSKPKNDAAPVQCPPSRATEQAVTCVWHAKPCGIFTYQDACRIPQTDKLGKKEAFSALQTDPDKFMWWLFAANLGARTRRVIGSGLVSSSIQERSDTNARLRFQRQDGSTIDIEILNLDTGFKTRLHNDDD